MTTIPMIPASNSRREAYGVLFESAFVYRTAASSFPTRVLVWDNTRRVNKRNGERVRFGDFGPIDGGNGQYLDPNNNATDAARSILLTTEATSIDAYGTGTGSVQSGQVWADTKLSDGAELELAFTDGRTEAVRVVFPRYSNGHGHAETI